MTRQTAAAIDGPSDDTLALGLSAPARWARHAIDVTASVRGVTRRGEFPNTVELVAQLPAAARAGWAALCERPSWMDVMTRVCGSYGWQQLTGMNYVHAGSSVDLLIDVRTAEQADQVAELLLAAESRPVRIDGELAFEDGASVAWREWLRFRSGQVERILVKRLARVTLEDATAWARAHESEAADTVARASDRVMRSDSRTRSSAGVAATTAGRSTVKGLPGRVARPARREPGLTGRPRERATSAAFKPRKSTLMRSRGKGVMNP